MRLILGFVLAFAIGAVCRCARIPSPAPIDILSPIFRLILFCHLMQFWWEQACSSAPFALCYCPSDGQPLPQLSLQTGVYLSRNRCAFFYCSVYLFVVVTGEVN